MLNLPNFVGLLFLFFPPKHIFMKSISDNYLNHSADLRPFYNYPPNELDFLQIIQNKVFTQEKRHTLYEVISEQYEGLAISEKTKLNKEKLLAANTYTITTGHQLGLFGGPLYTVYKVLTTLKLAEELSLKHPDYQFVAIFWIHTEDHDFAEINHFFDNFIEKKEYSATFSGPVGEHILTEEILSLIPKNFPEKWQKAYQVGKKMSHAYRSFMNDVLGEYGVLMLDANDKRLKKYFSKVISAELTRGVAAKCISQTNAQLIDLEYPTQIQAREINLFYQTSSMRNRIVKKGDYYEVLNTNLKFSEEEILQLAENEPEKFSPNVCLRPLYQEMILPNLVYFGGWAEVKYWLQLKGIFDYFGEQFPAVLPRMGATIFREEEAVEWEKLGLNLNQVTYSTNMLNAFLLWKTALWNAEEWGAKVSNSLQAIEQAEAYAKQIDENFGNSFRYFANETISRYAKAEKKLKKKIIQQNPAIFQTARKLKLSVQPDNSVQERVLSLAAFAEVDFDKMFRLLYAETNPLGYSHVYLRV